MCVCVCVCVCVAGCERPSYRREEEEEEEEEEKEEDLLVCLQAGGAEGAACSQEAPVSLKDAACCRRPLGIRAEVRGQRVKGQHAQLWMGRSLRRLTGVSAAWRPPPAVGRLPPAGPGCWVGAGGAWPGPG